MMDNSHRFAPAAPDEDTVFGACRPGYPGTNPSKKSVSGWIRFMRESNVDRVCCFLTDDELAAYDGDLLSQYREAFSEVCHVPIEDMGQRIDENQFRRDLFPFLRAADVAGDRTVVHCSAGLGRTGHVLALWLHYGRQYDVNKALETVRSLGRQPLESPDIDKDSLHEIDMLVSMYESESSNTRGRDLLYDFEQQLLTEYPDMRIERTKYWAPVSHPDFSHHLAQINPSKDKIRIFYPHEPNAHPALSPSSAGSYGESYPSEFHIKTQMDVSVAVDLIELYYTNDGSLVRP